MLSMTSSVELKNIPKGLKTRTIKKKSTQSMIADRINRVYGHESRLLRHRRIVEKYKQIWPSKAMVKLYDMYNKETKKKCNDQVRMNIIKQMQIVWMKEDVDEEDEEEKENIEDEEKDEERNKNLRRFVFKYYRYRFNEELNSDNNILLHEAFQLLYLIDNPDGIDYHKRWINLIVGSTQAGKTFLMIALSHIFAALGYDSVFFVKDTAQNTQFFSRKIADSDKLQESLKEHGFSKKDIEVFDKPLYHDSSHSKNSAEKFYEDLEATLNRTHRRSIVCLWNVVHVKRVVDNITHNSKIILFVDEAHKLGAYKRMSLDTENTTIMPSDESKKEPPHYDMMYLQLKVFAHKIFLFTATPQSILVSEPELYSDSLVLMPDGKDYRGLENSWVFNILPSHKDEKYVELNGPGSNGKVVKTMIPESFLKNIAHLSDKKPIKRINRFGVKDIHPINVMAKFEVTNEGQYMLLQAFKTDANALNDDHQKIIDTKWTSMIFNMHGIRLFDDKLRGETIKICGREYSDSNGCGEFLFPRDVVQIGDVLHWLWENGGSDKFPHIITFAYKSAEEGITFSSKWGETADTCANWHLTHIYSKMGQTITTANLEQSMGRANGNHGDTDMNGRPLVIKVSCTLAEKEKVIKGFNLHRQQTKDLCALKLEANDGRVIDFIKGYEVFSNRVPKQYYGIQGSQETIKKTVNPNAEVEEKSFTLHKRALSTLQMINPEHYGYKRYKRNKDKFDHKNNMADDEKEGDGLSGSSIPKPSKDGKDLDDYNKIIEYLSTRRNKWIPLVYIRRIFSDSKYNINLHDTRGQEYTTRGLMWQQPDGRNTPIYYALR